jgi:Herelleviridae exonuclease
LPEFTRLVIRNFLSYGNYKTVVPLVNLGVVRLEGQNLDNPSAESNMSGKSAIIDAISWVLWNRTLRGVKNNAIINRKHGKDCSVALSFRQNNIPFKVIRYRNHSHFGNRLSVFRDSVPLRSRHSADTQSTLDAILGMDYSQFCHCVLFGGTKSFSSLPDSEQKKVLESFLHFEEVDKALQRTRTKLKLIEQQLQETEIEYVDTAGRCNTLKSICRLHQRNLNRAHLQAQKENENSKRELRDAHRRLSRCRVRVRSYQERSTVSARLAEQADEELAKANGRWQSLQREKSSLTSKLRDSSIITERQCCESCGQRITKASIFQHRLHLERELSLLSLKLLVAKSLVNQRREEHEKYEATVNTIRQKLERNRASQRELEERIRKLRHELTGQPSSSFSFERELELSIRKYTRSVAKRLQIQRRRESLQKQKRDLEFWEAGFGNKGIKSIIVREALPSLNAKLREYANAIFEEPVELEFKPAKESKSGEERESFYVHYSNPKGGESYQAESSGGRRRVDLCVLLAMTWLSHSSNLLLVDELLDSLDAPGREKALEILKGLRKSVLVISHRKDIKSTVGIVWVVTKKGGHSRLNASIPS